MSTERPTAEVEDAIMRATFRALCEHGYAELSMRTIAEEFEKSKSLLYYHYGTKEELLLAFLDRLIGWIPARLEDTGTEDAPGRLVEFLAQFSIERAEESRAGFALALFELRLQAGHNPAFREKLHAHSQENQRTLGEIIAAGVDDGAFVEVGPDRMATWLYTAIEGARMNQIILGEERATDRTVEGLLEALDRYLLVEAGSLPREHLHQEGP